MGLPLRVSVVGAGQASPEESAMAEALGRALGAAGALVITGGLGGVMAAASRGCAEAGGIAVGILPGGDAAMANPWVRIPIATGLGEARNALVVRSGEAVVAVGGSWGTLSEIALACRMGISVALLGNPPADLPLHRPENPEEAAAWALREALESRSRASSEGTF
ncbi:TIGR00725 family protein [Gemmatimonadota bacterium]